MKKTVIILITIILAVIGLVSCEWLINEPEHEHTFEYIIYVTGHYKQYTCGCASPDIMGEHCDNDGDLCCDICKFVMSIAKDDIEWQYSETHHWWLPEVQEGGTTITVVYGYGEHENLDADMFCDICGYLMPVHEHICEYTPAGELGHFVSYSCGCPSPEGTEGHYDNDDNNLCDACSYQMVAEGNYFIRNQAGAEWLREINAEDIAEIKMISGGGGPLPAVSFTHISLSGDKAVISSIFEEYYWLDSKPVPEEKTQIADGGYFVVQLVLNNGEVKELHFINGDFYHDGNGNYFEIVRLPVFRYGTNFVTRYGFEIWDKYGQIYLVDGTAVCQIPVSEFEFVELTDDIYLGADSPIYYMEMNGERIYFLSEYYFYINDDRSTYYDLVGKTLYELIDEYTVLPEGD